MKRRLFIGSSREGEKIAQKLKQRIEEECGEWISPEIWSDEGIFKLNSNTLSSLAQRARSSEYGVLVATGDDYLESRDNAYRGVRDNVLLELGMFIGSLGLSRSFVLVESEVKMPSDYNGVTIPFFDRENPGSLERSIDGILSSIVNTKNSVNLTPSASAALAVGYFENFLLPCMNKLFYIDDTVLEVLIPQNLHSLNSSVEVYKRKHPSNEISIYGSGRPVIYQYQETAYKYWDIPTTLNTLIKVADIFVHQVEFGIDPEKSQWLEYEVRNFITTINLEAEKNPMFAGRFEVRRI